MDWFTSDLHLNHYSMLRYRTQFKTVEEMNEALMSMFDVVRKGDTVYILGDVAWDPEHAQALFDYLIMKKKVAKIHVIEGNHDEKWLGKIVPHPRLEICQTMTVKRQKNGFQSLFLSHYPQIIYNKSHYGSYQLHGHGHKDTSDRPLLDALVMGKRLNVCCELHDYKLWSREEIEEYMKNMPVNIDNVLCRGNDRQIRKVKRMLKKIHRILGGLNDIHLDNV